MTEIGEWMRAHLARPREAGVWDCCAMPSDWAVDQGWPDPMAPWRGAYSDKEGADAFISSAGGLLALFERGFGEAGIPVRDGAPEQGDVAVLRIGNLEAGSVYIGPRWAFIAERGLGFASVDPEAVVTVWAVSRG